MHCSQIWDHASLQANTTAMHSYDNAYVPKTVPFIEKIQGINFISCPIAESHSLQRPIDTYPKRRGVTRVKNLRDSQYQRLFSQEFYLPILVLLTRQWKTTAATLDLHCISANDGPNIRLRVRQKRRHEYRPKTVLKQVCLTGYGNRNRYLRNFILTGNGHERLQVFVRRQVTVIAVTYSWAKFNHATTTLRHVMT